MDVQQQGGAPRSASSGVFLARLMAFTSSKLLTAAVLFCLLWMLLGFEKPFAFAVLLFVGYLLADRFIDVRRCVILGGIAWVIVLIMGSVVEGNAPFPILFSAQHLFGFCGFFLAVAICFAFFVGRALYTYGFECGQEQADVDIARHITGRLIDHPDDWDQLDGDYLEVESAINRVRERQRADDQALRNEARRKDDLVTYLAHDLKTPLASVVGYLSLLHDAPELPAEQRERFTGVALEKAHRLDALIEEFFDITRFDIHDISLTRGYVDLNFMLGQVADEFYPILTEQGKHVEIDCEAGLKALVDGDKMARVFNNVMRNAIAYSFEGTTIRVSAKRTQPNEVVICFENQGDPIPEHKRKLIFEKFYRLDAARATNRGGAGLGLAIAREIIAAHNGTIDCSSTPEHTVFTIVLPA